MVGRILRTAIRGVKRKAGRSFEVERESDTKAAVLEYLSHSAPRRGFKYVSVRSAPSVDFNSPSARIRRVERVACTGRGVIRRPVRRGVARLPGRGDG